jgi:hypothetical protein
MTKVSPFISALPRSSSASSDSEEEPIVEQGVRPASLARRPRAWGASDQEFSPRGRRPAGLVECSHFTIPLLPPRRKESYLARVTPPCVRGRAALIAGTRAPGSRRAS